MSRSTRKARKITKEEAALSIKYDRKPEGVSSPVFGNSKEFATCDVMDNLQKTSASKPSRVSKRKNKNRAVIKLRDKNQFLVSGSVIFSHKNIPNFLKYFLSEAVQLNAILTTKNNEISKLHRDIVQTRFNLAEVNNETEALEEECSTIEADLMVIEDMINDKGFGYKLDKRNIPVITNSRLLAFGEESYTKS